MLSWILTTQIAPRLPLRDVEAFMNMKDDGDEEEGQFAKKRF